MNRNAAAQTGVIATAAALLSGGVIALNGQSGSAPVPASKTAWGTPVLPYKSIGGATWIASSGRATLWRGADPLASTASVRTCGAEGKKTFNYSIPVARPDLLADGASATLRYHVRDANGWVQGEIVAASGTGGRKATGIVSGAAPQQALTIFASKAELLATGTFKIAATLSVCGRNGGTGRLTLDSIEIAS